MRLLPHTSTNLFLGPCLQILADEGRLPQFTKGGLSSGRIRDKASRLEKQGNIIKFSVIRHPGAFKSTYDGKMYIQKWRFNFENLKLIKEPMTSQDEDDEGPPLS